MASSRTTALARVVLVAGALVALAAPAAADPGRPVEIMAVDTAAAPTVTATVSVDGPLAGTDLPPTAFRVDEAGESRPARVHRLRGDQLEAVLVVDTSGSMAGAPLDAAKAAAESFVAEAPAATRIALVGFGDTPVLASPLTGDRAALAAAIRGLQAGGETSLYDAVDLAVDLFAPGPGTRRHLALLSDGGDTASATTLDAVRARLAAAEVHLDVAELATGESRPQALAALAATGRGAVVPAAEPGALAPIYGSLGRDLANQFAVEATLTGHGRTSLRITVDHAGVHARAEIAVDLPAAAPAPAAPSPAAPVAVAVAEPDPTPWLTGAPARAAGAGLVLAGLLLGMSALPARSRRSPVARPAPGPGPVPALVEARRRAVDATDGLLERHDRRRGLSAALERAGIAARPGELLLVAAIVALVAFAAAALAAGPVVGAGAAAAVALVPHPVLAVRARRRQRRFHEQLGDNLALMASSLRSGYAVLQAVDAVAREASAPSDEEFRRVILEARLGRDLDDSLRALAARVGGEDVEWVAEALEINREVGGDLAEILDNIAGTIRERDRVRRHARVLTAEGRVSAVVLVALPPLLAAVLSVVNPGYMEELRSGTGLVLSAVGAAMLAAGSLWMNRMVKVEY